MVTMNWKKDAAGRLAAEWKGGGTETVPAKPVCRYHKAVRAKFQTHVSAKPHLRRTWR